MTLWDSDAREEGVQPYDLRAEQRSYRTLVAHGPLVQLLPSSCPWRVPRRLSPSLAERLPFLLPALPKPVLKFKRFCRCAISVGVCLPEIEFAEVGICVLRLPVFTVRPQTQQSTTLFMVQRRNHT